MSQLVTIIDYGMGNIQSVSRAFARCGAEVLLTGDLEKIAQADRLVLPGVGAFGQGMVELKKRHLIDVIKTYVKTGRPFLGICLGLQMMFQESEEAPGEEGLGLVEGTVTKVPGSRADGRKHKIPHIGWSSVKFSESERAFVSGIPDLSEFYFVHSFSAMPKEEKYVLGRANYNDHSIVAILQKENLIGTQFHPEKSADLGLKMISNFLKM